MISLDVDARTLRVVALRKTMRDKSRRDMNCHVDTEDRNTVTIRDGVKGNPNKTIINESGLCSFVF